VRDRGRSGKAATGRNSAWCPQCTSQLLIREWENFCAQGLHCTNELGEKMPAENNILHPSPAFHPVALPEQGQSDQKVEG